MSADVVLKEELGTVVKGTEVKIPMDPAVQPQFLHVPLAPLALRPRVEKQLEDWFRTRITSDIRVFQLQ